MLRVICNLLVGIIMVGALALAGILGIPLLQGHELYAVLTASMEPTYPVDSIVVVERVSGDAIEINDVITFEAAGFETVVTHRVIDIDGETGALYTKGDNNDNADFYPVAPENVRGRVIRGIPRLGALVSAVNTQAGRLALIWVVFVVVLLLILPDLVDRVRGNKNDNVENNLLEEEEGDKNAKQT